jgi:hypothetical protein
LGALLHLPRPLIIILLLVVVVVAVLIDEYRKGGTRRRPSVDGPESMGRVADRSLDFMAQFRFEEPVEHRSWTLVVVVVVVLLEGRRSSQYW